MALEIKKPLRFAYVLLMPVLFCVFAVRFDQHVNIAGETRGTMKCQCVTPYDEVLNFMGVEQLEQFFEVFLYVH
ncbi:hypothetical protein ES703_21138 [subsurface metagenome]